MTSLVNSWCYMIALVVENTIEVYELQIYIWPLVQLYFWYHTYYISMLTYIEQPLNYAVPSRLLPFLVFFVLLAIRSCLLRTCPSGVPSPIGNLFLAIHVTPCDFPLYILPLHSALRWRPEALESLGLPRLSRAHPQFPSRITREDFHPHGILYNVISLG